MTLTKLRLAALFGVVALLATGAVLAGTGTASDSDQPAPPAANPPAKAVDKRKKPDLRPMVKLVRPHQGGIDRTMLTACSAEPFQQADLYPGAIGAMKAMNVDIGDRVKKGQLLAEIEAPDLAVDTRLAAVGVEQAKGLVREAQARVNGARAEVVAAEAAIRQRQSEAAATKAGVEFRKKSFERFKELFNNKAVDQKILDEAEQQYLTADEASKAKAAAIDGAKADLNVKKAKLTEAEAPIESAKANLDAAQLRLEKAEIALAYTKIKAPFDGVVTRRNLYVGDYVRPERTGDRAHIFTIVRVDTIRVVTQVPDHVVTQVEAGTPAELSFDGIPGSHYAAKVARIGYVEDPKTQTMRAEIDVPNPDGKIRPGMFGKATLTIARAKPGDLWVPNTAIYYTNDGAYLFVVRDGKARWTLIRVGWNNGDKIKVASGLKADDQVVEYAGKLVSENHSQGGDDIPVRVESPAPRQ
jgi:HlyD family secretion protein